MPTDPAWGDRAREHFRVLFSIEKEGTFLHRDIRRSPLFTLLVLLGTGLAFSVTSLTQVPWNYAAASGGVWKSPALFWLNTLPVLLCLLLLWLATGYAWISCLATGTVVFLLSGIHYFKLLFRDDPMRCEDLLRLREGRQMMKQYHVVLTTEMRLWIAGIVALTILLFFVARGRPKATPRLLLLTAVVLAAMVFGSRVCLNDTLYRGLGSAGGDGTQTETEQYLARGFLYPFLHSSGAAFDLASSGYDAAEAAHRFASYSDATIPEDKKVSIVSIQLEAYADLSVYDIDGLSRRVYRDYHTLAAESYTGRLLTDTFAGGTTKTEWAVLTGGNAFGNFQHKTDSVAWYLKSQGYLATGAHPSHDWFYNRREVNPNLGLDNYLFMENYFAQRSDDPDVAYDDVFFPALEELLEEQFAQSDQPVFSFNVTYQGHGPYNSDRTWWGDDLCTGSYSTATRNILNNYFYAQKNTNGHLLALRNYLQRLDRPVVLLLYGDHKPWLGNGSSVYEELGISLDTATQEGFCNYYATQYLIWANDAAKKVLGNDFVGTGPDLSPCFLMDEVFSLCSWEGSAYQQAQRQTARALPVLHTTGWCERDGLLTRDLTKKERDQVTWFQALSYYDRYRAF